MLTNRLASTEFTPSLREGQALSFRRAQPAWGERVRSLSEVEGSGNDSILDIKVEGIHMPYLYILECSDGTYYTGSTIDLEKRLWEHENGLGANHTKKRLPVKLVYAEAFDRIDDAFFREKQVQGWTHAKKKALIERNFSKIHELAECRNASHNPRKG